ncbi:MAG TPA: hypothetical protein PLM91_04100, partial [Bacillota bacterium]|nr:hypothetical protein [Bacillota bacterium]
NRGSSASSRELAGLKKRRRKDGSRAVDESVGFSLRQAGKRLEDKAEGTEIRSCWVLCPLKAGRGRLPSS